MVFLRESILFNLLIFLSFSFNYANDLKIELQNKINSKTPKWILDQISSDLGNISKITTELIDKTFAECEGHLSRYKISNGKVTRYDNSPTPNAEKFCSYILELNRYVSLPDVDFIVCTDDYPIAKNGYPTPVLGFCTCKCEKNVILIPDHQVLHLVKYGYELNQVYEGVLKYSWEKKISKAVWRGGNSGGITANNFKDSPRVKIVDISKKFPDLLDAKISRFYQFDEPYVDEMLKVGDYLGPALSIVEQMRYKYQILLDGNCASWPGAYWRLYSNCLVLKQISTHKQWYYSLLQPYVHYVPIANDLSDLVEKIEWAKNNDDKAQEIIKNANKLVADSLKYADILYYIYVAIVNYAKLQNSDK